MNIRQYLDSTYLKTAEQAGITETENREIVKTFIQEAIDEDFKLIMIRSEYVSMTKEMIASANSKVTVGTVIDFPKGLSSLENKLAEAKKAVENGADDLDFVCNYEAFKRGELDLVRNEILAGSRLGLENGKIVKWIIEVAALNNEQIAGISNLIKEVVTAHFDEKQFDSVFVKSSTGFYQTENNLPKGATIEAVLIMLENSSPLPVKAAGGVRSYEDVLQYVQMGVKRIGTSSAKAIVDGEVTAGGY